MNKTTRNLLSCNLKWNSNLIFNCHWEGTSYFLILPLYPITLLMNLEKKILNDSETKKRYTRNNETFIRTFYKGKCIILFRWFFGINWGVFACHDYGVWRLEKIKKKWRRMKRKTEKQRRRYKFKHSFFRNSSFLFGKHLS